MNFLLTTVLSYLLVYKYAALFTITLLAAIALPIPSAAPLMASAAFASQGYLNIAGVFASAAAGNILGDNIGYWVARRYGKRVLYKLGFRKILESKIFKALEHRITDRPGPIIVISRIEVIATLSVNFISGLSNMPYRTYLFYEVLGELLQVGAYATIGYFFGSQWETINDLIGKFSIVIILIIALFFAIFWKRFLQNLTKSI